MKRGAACHDNLQCGARAKQIGNEVCGLENLLEVVQDEHDLAFLQVAEDRVQEGPRPGRANVERLRNRGQDQIGISDGGKRDEKDSA